RVALRDRLLPRDLIDDDGTRGRLRDGVSFGDRGLARVEHDRRLLDGDLDVVVVQGHGWRIRERDEAARRLPRVAVRDQRLLALMLHAHRALGDADVDLAVTVPRDREVRADDLDVRVARAHDERRPAVALRDLELDLAVLDVDEHTAVGAGHRERG